MSRTSSRGLDSAMATAAATTAAGYAMSVACWLECLLFASTQDSDAVQPLFLVSCGRFANACD